MEMLASSTRVIPPDGNEAADTNVVKTDYSGASVTVTDQAGKKRRSETDALGRLIRVWEPDASQNLVHVTRYHYDPLDNLLCVHQKSTDPTADKECSDPTVPATWRPRVFTYNSLSQLLTATNPESGTISYAYDNDGNLLTKTDARGITITHTYDSLHRLTQKTYSDGTPSASFQYDLSSAWGVSVQNPVGRLVLATQATGTTGTLSSYDAMGRVKNQWQCTPANCGSGSFALSYSYNYAGAVTSYTDGAGHTFTNSYDAAGRVTGVTSSLVDAQHPASLVSGVTYFPSGASQQMTLGNGLMERMVLNTRLQPCRITVYSSGTAPVNCGDAAPSGNLLDFTYGFSLGTANNGNVASWSAAGRQTFSRSYAYDELNRLAGMSGAGGGCTVLTWSYDAWGNRTNQSTGQGGGSCSEHHPAVTVQNRIAELTYDAAGNVTYDPATLAAYACDAENRLISINNGAVATYNCNAAGQRDLCLRRERPAGENLLQIRSQPVEEIPVPEFAVLGLQDPVALVGKDDEF
jgi:YD repeat-containing protein